GFSGGLEGAAPAAALSGAASPAAPHSDAPLSAPVFTRPMQPHRGILVLGMALACVCPAVSLAAGVLACLDLMAMKQGRMDPAGWSPVPAAASEPLWTPSSAGSAARTSEAPPARPPRHRPPSPRQPRLLPTPLPPSRSPLSSPDRLRPPPDRRRRGLACRRAS